MATAVKETPSPVEQRSFRYMSLKELNGHPLDVVETELRFGPNFEGEIVQQAVIWGLYAGEQVCITTDSQRLVSLVKSGLFPAGKVKIYRREFPPGYWVEKL